MLGGFGCVFDCPFRFAARLGCLFVDLFGISLFYCVIITLSYLSVLGFDLSGGFGCHSFWFWFGWVWFRFGFWVCDLVVLGCGIWVFL